MSKKEKVTEKVTARAEKTRQVQLVQRESLVTALKEKAQLEHVSTNELANRAITKYIKMGGDNIEAEPTKRMMLLIPPSMYDNLSELSKRQGTSINTSVEHALERCVAGEQTDNTRNRLIVYITRTAKLDGKVRNIVSTVNEAYGGMRDMMADINELREKRVPKSREKERHEEILIEVDRLWAAVEKMVDKVDEIHLESEFED